MVMINRYLKLFLRLQLARGSGNGHNGGDLGADNDDYVVVQSHVVRSSSNSMREPPSPAVRRRGGDDRPLIDDDSSDIEVENHIHNSVSPNGGDSNKIGREIHREPLLAAADAAISLEMRPIPPIRSDHDNDHNGNNNNNNNNTMTHTSPSNSNGNKSAKDNGNRERPLLA
jgi:hypothetical protein